jgi:hypothetical protein
MPHVGKKPRGVVDAFARAVFAGVDALAAADAGVMVNSYVIARSVIAMFDRTGVDAGVAVDAFG